MFQYNKTKQNKTKQSVFGCHNIFMSSGYQAKLSLCIEVNRDATCYNTCYSVGIVHNKSGHFSSFISFSIHFLPLFFFILFVTIWNGEVLSSISSLPYQDQDSLTAMGSGGNEKLPPRSGRFPTVGIVWKVPSTPTQHQT